MTVGHTRQWGTSLFNGWFNPTFLLRSAEEQTWLNEAQSGFKLAVWIAGRFILRLDAMIGRGFACIKNLYAQTYGASRDLRHQREDGFKQDTTAQLECMDGP